jgi:hypothetical protein
MSDFDDKLRQALENGEPIELDRQESLRDMLAQSFKVQQRWMVLFLWVEGLAVMVAGIWAGVSLYRAQELKPLIVWSTVLIVCSVFFVLVKVVGWQWMNKYSILREIKRLELQISALKESRRPEDDA